jgi:hypothetical protein
MIDLPMPRARWPHHWLALTSALNLILATAMAAVVALGGRSPALAIGMVLAAASFIVIVGAALLQAMRWLLEHRGGPSWFVVPMAVLLNAALLALTLSLGETWLGLSPPADLLPAAMPILALAGMAALILGMGIMLDEVARALRAEQLTLEAQLASVAARPNSHALFNTLTAIRAAIRRDPEHAERLVGHLALLLRVAPDPRDRLTVPLEEEMKVVTAYLEIEATRSGRLSCAIEVPPELGGCAVPPGVLRTLVENSVTHVVKAWPGPRRLRVTAGVVGDVLELGVWDDGPGFGLEAVPPGRGLDRLRQRLEALYGAEAGLKVRRRDEGTLVTVRVPVRRAA